MQAIVLSLRGCSAGWLGAYGNEWIATPNLDRLAVEGVVFDRHISDCPDPVAAARVWLTGQPEACATPPVASLPATLRAAGVPAVLVRANHPDNDAPDWFYADWSEVFDVRPQEEDRLCLESLRRDLPALLDRLAREPQFLLWIEIDSLVPPWTIRQDVFEAYVSDSDESEEPARETRVDEDEDEGEGEIEDNGVEDDDEEDEDDTAPELDELATEPSPVASDFAVRDRDEPATPWTDPPTGPFDATDVDAREWLHWSLAALVTGLDAELGVLFEQFRGRGFDRTAAWLLTSDFGFPLGEHGFIGRHRPWLHEELVHLPLILRLPGSEEACRRIAAFSQPADLAPTLLNLLGLPHGNLPGASLLPVAYGRGTVPRDCAISKLELGAAAECAIRTDDWAYLLPLRVPEGETHEPRLYAKPDDRCEVNDLRARGLDRADELETRLRQSIDNC